MVHTGIHPPSVITALKPRTSVHLSWGLSQHHWQPLGNSQTTTPLPHYHLNSGRQKECSVGLEKKTLQVNMALTPVHHYITAKHGKHIHNYIIHVSIPTWHVTAGKLGRFIAYWCTMLHGYQVNLLQGWGEASTWGQRWGKWGRVGGTGTLLYLWRDIWIIFFYFQVSEPKPIRTQGLPVNSWTHLTYLYKCIL